MKLEQLRVEARDACRCRGHDMRRWKTVKSMSGKVFKHSTCRKCGAWADVTATPDPNDIEIGGLAVATNCLGSKEALLAEENKVRAICGQYPTTLERMFKNV